MAKLNNDVLTQLIKEYYGTRKAFTEALGIDPNTPINWAKKQTIADATIDMIVNHFNSIGANVTAADLDERMGRLNKKHYQACMDEVQKIAERTGYPTDGASLAKWASLIYESGRSIEDQTAIIETAFEE